MSPKLFSRKINIFSTQAYNNVDRSLTQKKNGAVKKKKIRVFRKADKICVVHGGNVTEEGSHDELMSKPDSRYKVLVDAAEGRGGSMAM